MLAGFSPKIQTLVNLTAMERNMIVINKKKVVEIVKNRLREERKPLLEELDFKFMAAQEQGLPVEEIVKQKQLLRDITDKKFEKMELSELGNLTIEKLLDI